MGGGRPTSLPNACLSGRLTAWPEPTTLPRGSGRARDPGVLAVSSESGELPMGLWPHPQAHKELSQVGFYSPLRAKGCFRLCLLSYLPKQRFQRRSKVGIQAGATLDFTLPPPHFLVPWFFHGNQKAVPRLSYLASLPVGHPSLGTEVRGSPLIVNSIKRQAGCCVGVGGCVCVRTGKVRAGRATGRKSYIFGP